MEWDWDAPSPLIFNVLNEDMDNIWHRRNEGGSVVEKEKMSTLKVFDDMILVSDDGTGLKSMIATKNKVTIIISNTKILIFQKGGRETRKTKSGPTETQS